MSNPELAALIALPILASTLPLLLGLRFDSVGWPIAMATTLVEAGLAAFLVAQVAREERLLHALGGYERTYGIELVADGLSAAVVALVAVVTLVVLVYARRAGPRRNSFYSSYLLLFGGLMGVSLTGDAFNLFVFLEIVGLATYALVAADRSGRSALAALKYLLVGTVGASLYLVGVGYLFVSTGTLNMVELSQALPALERGYSDPLVVASFAFVAVGLSVKAAVFPLHTWMPDAYAESPNSVTAYISGLVSTVGAYALARLIYTVYTPAFFAEVPLAQDALVAVATLSVVAGSVLAVIQRDLKRMLAYSSVAQFGMIVAAFGLATPQSLLGGVVHLVGHGLMKTGLFLCVGVLAAGHGVRTVRRYASVGYRSPIPAAALGVLLLALVGIPPSIGFLGKWYIAWGAVEAGAPVVAAVVFASTLMTLAYAARILEALYFTPPGAVDPDGTIPTDAGPGGAAAEPTAADGGTSGPAGSPDDAPPSDDTTPSDGAPSSEDAAPSDGATPSDDGLSSGDPVTAAPVDRPPVSTGMVLAAVTMAVLVVGLGFAGPAFESLLGPFLETVL